MTVNYSFQDLKEDMAKAYGRNLSISTKKAVEICNFIRHKNVQDVKAFLLDVSEKKAAVPMKRFNMDTAHKKGMGPGKYPVKAAKAILGVIESAEMNGQNQGLSTADLVIVHAAAHKASRPWHYGRQRRRKMKRSHVEIVLAEKKEKSGKKK